MNKAPLDIERLITDNAQTYKDIAGIQDFESRGIQIYVTAAALLVALTMNADPRAVDLGFVELEITDRYALGAVIAIALVFMLVVHLTAWLIESRGHRWRFKGRQYVLEQGTNEIGTAVIANQGEVEKTAATYRSLQDKQALMDAHYAPQLVDLERAYEGMSDEDKYGGAGWDITEKVMQLENERQKKRDFLFAAFNARQNAILDKVVQNNASMDVLKESLDDMPQALRLRGIQLFLLFWGPVSSGVLALLALVTLYLKTSNG
ncbi:MAG: hypothetical protein IPN62_02510 [Flavobacteriales bacterium]|nr:hypothetical protein [Flavobacteriales bacterium]